MPNPDPAAAIPRWRRVVSEWVSIIWLVSLLVLPYAMGLSPLRYSQTIAGLVFGILILVKWLVSTTRNLACREDPKASAGGASLRNLRPVLVIMTLISFFAIVYGTSYWNDRLREVAGVADRAPVQAAMGDILTALQSGRANSLAGLLKSGAISPQDLRPSGMSIAPAPAGFGRLKHALALRHSRAISEAVKSYSVFRLLRAGNLAVPPGIGPGLGGRIPVPLLLSRRLYDRQFGWVRLLGFSDGEVVEIVGSRWACSGTGPINPALPG